jgi:serine/threonine protein kinase
MHSVPPPSEAFEPPDDDDGLSALVGHEIRSELVPGTSYRILSVVGSGASSVALRALRHAPEGECLVVVKVMRPWFVLQAGAVAALTVKKEAVALGRLNERVPATPFVVRFIDTGTLVVAADGSRVEVPWVVVEYVHGGLLGTTLTERVTNAVRATGFAFDPARAALAIECLAAGLGAVHEVGVIHRDIKPSNVLCCGSDEEEIFKIADFGVAKPVGLAATFGGVVVGTLGYAAPELELADPKAIGPSSDVFSFAAVIYFLLTGDRYFRVKTPGDLIVAVATGQKRSLEGRRFLSPHLRDRKRTLSAIDYALGCATRAEIDKRPQTAGALASMIVPWLRDAVRVRGGSRHAEKKKVGEDDTTRLARWTWTVLHRPSSRVIRSVAWDGDGRAMAATNAGLSFWNGTQWLDASLGGFPDPTGIRFVRRVAAGRWLIGGDDATVATYTAEGIGDVRRIPGIEHRFDLLSGALDDLAVLVEVQPGEPPVLAALSSRRWLRPLPLPDFGAVADLARIEDARWLVVGRGADGRAHACVYAPLEWQATPLASPGVRAFIACAGRHDKGLGLAAGAGGAVLWWQQGAAVHESVPGGDDLSAAAIDSLERGWVAGRGRIWLRRAPGSTAAPGDARPARWERVWDDPSWTAPIVSLWTDQRGVVAMTADGGVIEGRAEMR